MPRQDCKNAGQAASRSSLAQPGKSLQLASCKLREKATGGATVVTGGQLGQGAHVTVDGQIGAFFSTGN
jgi:hypothetical protein